MKQEVYKLARESVEYIHGSGSTNDAGIVPAILLLADVLFEISEHLNAMVNLEVNRK